MKNSLNSVSTCLKVVDTRRKPSYLERELRKILSPAAVLSEPEELLLYEYDASLEQAIPDVVVFPTSTEDVVRIACLANAAEVPLVGRGAGTGLSGGALAQEGGILLVFSRMNRILEIDLEDRYATVQPGVVNMELTDAVSEAGYYFAPDPSSQKACTIGGNIAENAGGPHTLATGVTSNHVLGLEVVLPSGETLRLGGKHAANSGYDLTGLLVGSEGTLAIITEAVVRLSRLPESVETALAIFPSLDDASQTVVDLTAEGVTPSACELMDQTVLASVEAFVHAGYPQDAAAVLLLEVEGLRETVLGQFEQTQRVCHRHHAREIRLARSEGERQLLWKGRKNVFGALGRLAPSIYTQDAVVPRTKLPTMLHEMGRIGRQHGIVIGCVAHAGDGNLHPIFPMDPRNSELLRSVGKAATDIMRVCIALGGTITGEHGVGLEKRELMPLMFSEDDLQLMGAVKSAFNPKGRLNPGKIFPLHKSCGEIRIRPVNQRG